MTIFTPPLLAHSLYSRSDENIIIDRSALWGRVIVQRDIQHIRYRFYSRRYSLLAV